MGKFWIQHPWKDGLLLATLLTTLTVLASLFWQAGYPQWAFLLLFGVLWLFAGVCLANDRFNEESGLILARALDENMDQMRERIHQLQDQLAALNSSLARAG